MRFVGLLLLACLNQASERPLGATVVVHHTFDENPERVVTQPVGWRREFAPGYPSYIDAGLTTEKPATGARSLLFKLNGGNVAYFSPPVPASTDYNYALQAKIRTEKLVEDRALVLLEFLDEGYKVIGPQHLSERLSGTKDWTTVLVGPVAPRDGRVRYLRVACLTQHGKEMDLDGRAWFDDLWVGRLPRFEISTSREFRLFDLADEKQISVQVFGAEGRRYHARFYLSDENGRLLAEQQVELVDAPPKTRQARWVIPAKDVGFFHVEVALSEGNRRILTKDFPITVVRPLTFPITNEFGLSAPSPPFGLSHYDRLMEASACRWLKMPLWGEAARDRELGGSERRLTRFIEKLRLRGQEVVGALVTPPPTILANLPRASVGVADVFALSRDQWGPEIEGIMARQGLDVSSWQVGGDEDYSFEGLRHLDQTIGNLREQMNLIGREIRLGLTWSWLSPPPVNAGLAFLNMTDVVVSPGAGASSEPAPLTGDQLLSYLSRIRSSADAAAGGAASEVRLRSPSQPAIWVPLIPLSASRYDRFERLLDLSTRAIAAKVGGADAIFAGRMLDQRHGLVDREGVPTELFTIWRTLAEHLGHRRYIGRLSLPGDVLNEVFVDRGQATIVLRHESAKTCELVCGGAAFVVDLWGRTAPLRATGATQVVPIGRLPVIVHGVSEGLMRFQMDARFSKGRLSSEYGVQNDSLLISNPFSTTINARIRTGFPASWRARPETLNIQVRPGETASAPITFDIPQGTPQQDIDLPMEIELNANEAYRFVLHRPYRLGGEEVKTTSSTRLLPDGSLEVTVGVTNLTDRPMTLRSTLRAFNRPAEQAAFQNLEPNQSATRRFLLPRGKSLLGEPLRLELRQIGGRRQFNLDIPANPG